MSGKEPEEKESEENPVLNQQEKQPRGNLTCIAESTKSLELATLGPLRMDMEVKLKTRGLKEY